KDQVLPPDFVQEGQGFQVYLTALLRRGRIHRVSDTPGKPRRKLSTGNEFRYNLCIVPAMRGKRRAQGRSAAYNVAKWKYNRPGWRISGGLPSFRARESDHASVSEVAECGGAGGGGNPCRNRNRTGPGSHPLRGRLPAKPELRDQSVPGGVWQ